MSTWFYQLNQQLWSPERYRLEIWENERWSWGVGENASTEEPESGDTVAFYYGHSSGGDPGFYGWAVVLEWLSEEPQIHFRPVRPSDLLKMRPWWEPQAHDLADRIRGGMKQRTLWQVSDELARELRDGITRWTGTSTATR